MKTQELATEIHVGYLAVGMSCFHNNELFQVLQDISNNNTVKLESIRRVINLDINKLVQDPKLENGEPMTLQYKNALVQSKNNQTTPYQINTMKTELIVNARQFNNVSEYVAAVGIADFTGEWMDLARFLNVPLNPKGGRRSISDAWKSLNADSETAAPKKSVSTKVAVVQTAATVQIPTVEPEPETAEAAAPAVVTADAPKSKAPRRADFPKGEDGEDEFDAAMTAWVMANPKKPATVPAVVIEPKPEVAPVVAAASVVANIAQAADDSDNVEETALQLAKLLKGLKPKSKTEAAPIDADKLAELVQATVKEQTQGMESSLEQLNNILIELEKQIGSGVKTIQVQVNSQPATKIDGLVHERFEDILLHVSVRDNVMLVGPAGSGKTTVCENVATALNLDFFCKSVCAQTSKSELLGYMDANGNFVSTEFRVAYETGGVFVLDEIDAGNPNVIAVLNSALANSYCAFADGMIRKHEDFVLIACANTFGTGASREYVGRNQLDSATLDRFSVIEFGYDEKLELALSADETFCKFVQAARRELASERIVISPRASIQGGKLLAAGAKPEHVLQTRIIKGMAPALADRTRNVFARFYR